ncbi:50S ribosomal protein L17 [bacterium]|nr:50S ribosomal protein L17 [bacterium]|tara:strand:- start:552 stop:902 length:351 start_codon:yes stop_codon:yes gene_type:complete
MQHSKQKRALGRKDGQRTALLRGLAVELLSKGRISTTTAKARELRPFVEKIITAAKSDTVVARRTTMSRLGEPKAEVAKVLFEDVAKKYVERDGGYTRIIKVGRSNGRDEAIIELV